MNKNILQRKTNPFLSFCRLGNHQVPPVGLVPIPIYLFFLALPNVAEGLHKVFADEGHGSVRGRDVEGEGAAAALDDAGAGSVAGGSAAAGRVAGIAAVAAASARAAGAVVVQVLLGLVGVVQSGAVFTCLALLVHFVHAPLRARFLVGARHVIT